MAPPRVQEPPARTLVSAARNGDEDAFRRLVDPHRPSIQELCYQMLGSLQDAEDALQESLLRAWRAISGFEERSSVKTWLHRIATNICLDALRRRQSRGLGLTQAPGAAAADDRAPLRPAEAWIEPFPDPAQEAGAGHAGPEARYERREAVELAFVAALQLLPPRQRAVLVLRDVLGFSAAEAATMTDATTPSVNSALNRARRTLEDALPDRSQQATMRAIGDRRLREIVDRFVGAFERAEVDEILALLSADAAFAMPPFEGCSRGREAIGESWLMPTGAAGELRYLETRANGQLALAVYRIDLESGRFLPLAIDVLTLRADGQIGQVVAFRTPEAFAGFGLPPALPA